MSGYASAAKTNKSLTPQPKPDRTIDTTAQNQKTSGTTTSKIGTMPHHVLFGSEPCSAKIYSTAIPSKIDKTTKLHYPETPTNHSQLGLREVNTSKPN